MKTPLACSLGLAMALPLFAQTPTPAPTAQPAPETQQGPVIDPYAPQLLGNVNDTTGDSRLVRAAKNTVVVRRRMTGRNWRIDDSMVGHQLAQTSTRGSAPAVGGAGNSGGGASNPASHSANTFSSSAPGPSRAQLQARKASLKNEQERMSQESDQPYSGDVDQEHAEQKLTQAPAQINQVDQQLERKPPQE